MTMTQARDAAQNALNKLEVSYSVRGMFDTDVSVSYSLARNGVTYHSATLDFATPLVVYDMVIDCLLNKDCVNLAVSCKVNSVTLR